MLTPALRLAEFEQAPGGQDPAIIRLWRRSLPHTKFLTVLTGTLNRSRSVDVSVEVGFVALLTIYRRRLNRA